MARYKFMGWVTDKSEMRGFRGLKFSKRKSKKGYMMFGDISIQKWLK